MTVPGICSGLSRFRIKQPPQPSSCRHGFVIFLIQALVVFLLFAYYFQHDRFMAIHHTKAQNGRSVLVILVWTWPFGYEFPLNECPEHFDSHHCFFTDNRSFYGMADAVIFHHREVCRSRSQMPQIPRPKGQYWVWYNMESPSHSPNLNYMDKLFNLTMTYRSDSDIFNPYGWVEKNKPGIKYNIPNKSQLAAWVISNWNPNSKRIGFYKELKKYIPIEIYGEQHVPLAIEKAHMVLSKYKFYLAFENSIHKDYITEKFWVNALQSGCVPVVLGPPREDYEKFIPADAFIHVNDFSSVKELASYLLELDKDDERYEQYFTWRATLQPVQNVDFSTQYCKACQALHRAPPYRTVASVAKWFST